jgi:hypothetical protein
VNRSSFLPEDNLAGSHEPRKDQSCSWFHGFLLNPVSV